MSCRAWLDLRESWEFPAAGHGGAFPTGFQSGIAQVNGWDGSGYPLVVWKAGPFVRREGVSGIEDENPAISEIEFGGLPGWFGAGPPVGGREVHGVAPAPELGDVERLHGVDVEGRTRGVAGGR